MKKLLYSWVFLIILFTVYISNALEAHVFYYLHGGLTPDGRSGVYRANMQTGEVHPVFFVNARLGTIQLIEQGKKLWITTGSQRYIVNNDGTDVQQITDDFPNLGETHPVWTSNGIMYGVMSPVDRVGRYNLQTKEYTEIPFQGYTDFTAKPENLRFSHDGKTIAFYAGGNALGYVNDQFTAVDLVEYCRYRGHGFVISPDGKYTFKSGIIEFYPPGPNKHDPYITILDDESRRGIGDCPYDYGYAMQANHNLFMDNDNPARVENNSEWLIAGGPLAADGVHDPYRHLQDESPWKLFMLKWSDPQEIYQIPGPRTFSSNTPHHTCGWIGPLPNPHSGPAVGLDQLEITLYAGETGGTKTIVAKNVGLEGDIGSISVSKSSDADWLTTSITSGMGHEITLTADPSKMADAEQCTLTVTSSSTQNSIKCIVLGVNATRIAAPTDLRYEAKGAYLRDIELTWTDNSSNENSFQIERSESDTLNWKVLGSVDANQTSFTDTNVSYGRHYYRVRSTTRTLKALSDYEKTLSVTVTGNEWIHLESPSNGEKLLAGSTYPISWTGRNISLYTVLYSVDGGRSWEDLAATGEAITPEESRFDWEVPASGMKECIIKVSDYEQTISSNTVSIEIVDNPGEPLPAGEITTLLQLEYRGPYIPTGYVNEVLLDKVLQRRIWHDGEMVSTIGDRDYVWRKTTVDSQWVDNRNPENWSSLHSLTVYNPRPRKAKFGISVSGVTIASSQVDSLTVYMDGAELFSKGGPNNSRNKIYDESDVFDIPVGYVDFIFRYRELTAESWFTVELLDESGEPLTDINTIMPEASKPIVTIRPKALAEKTLPLALTAVKAHAGFALRFQAHSPWTLHVLTANGRTAFSASGKPGVTHLPIGGLSRGVFFVRMLQSSGMTVKRILLH